MSLYDGNTTNQESEKTRKLKRIILISIIILVIMMIGIIIGIVMLSINEKDKVKYAFNGKLNTQDVNANKLYSLLKNIEIKDSGEVYFDAPIKEIAQYFGYNSYNGTYEVASEDTNSCYVQNENEVAVFELDSDVVKKKDLTMSNSSYETFKTNDKIYKENDILYTNKEGIEKAFNVNISYNKNTKTIAINTLDYYVSLLSPEDTSTESFIQKLGYRGLDTSFSNQKAILDNLLVVTNETGKYGCIYAPELEYGVNLSTKNMKQILETKYDTLSYMQQSETFLFKSNNKWGTISNQGVTKISPDYDTLELIDNENQLYLVSMDRVYGVVNSDGNEVIEIKYSKIGIDINRFNKNVLTNEYILLNSLIPVSLNNKWSFYNLSGDKVSQEEFDEIGCITKKTLGTTYNLVVVPECNTVIVGQRINEKVLYGCMDVKGNVFVTCQADDAYLQINSGKNDYFIEKNNSPKDIVQIYNKKYNVNNNENTQTENTESNNDENTQIQNTDNNQLNENNNKESGLIQNIQNFITNQ